MSSWWCVFTFYSEGLDSLVLSKGGATVCRDYEYKNNEYIYIFSNSNG